jgi:hypothetical protein
MTTSRTTYRPAGTNPARDRLALVVAGLAAAAGPWASGAVAQSAVLIDIEDTTLLPGQSTMVTLSAAWPPSEWAMAVIVTDLGMPDGAGVWTDLVGLGAMRGPGATPGVASEGGVSGIVATQLNFGPSGWMPDRSNPIAFWRGTFTAPDVVASPYEFDLTTMTSRFDVYIRPDSVEMRSYLPGLAEGRETIRVVPAPASLAVIAMGGVLASRRRR